MADPVIAEEIVEAVAIGNLKSISEQPAMLSNLAYSNSISNVNLAQQNAVSNQQAQNEVGISVTGKTIQILTTLGPLESKCSNEILTGNIMAEQISNLKATLEAFQQKQNIGPVPRPVPPYWIPGQSAKHPLPSGKYYAQAPNDFVFKENVGVTTEKNKPATGETTVVVNPLFL